MTADISSVLAGVSLVGVISIIIGWIRVKHTLKEEIVDPEISQIKLMMTTWQEQFARKLAKVEEENNRMSDKLDRKFDELNSKMDKNSQVVSQMQGMLTAMFNGMRDNQYGQ